MTALAAGAIAPAFDLPGTDGANHTWSEISGGNAALIVFTCNHCPYAKAWEDRLNAIASDYAARGVGTVAISANDPVQYPEDSFEEMQRRAEEKNYSFPYLFDESQDVVRAYGAERTPEVFLFDDDGRLRYHGAIDDDSDETQAAQPYLRDALDALLEGNEPPVGDTAAVGCTVKWR